MRKDEELVMDLLSTLSLAERQRLGDELDAYRASFEEKNRFITALEVEQRDKGFALARALAAEAERDEARRLLRGVLKADQQDAQMGYPIPGDSCMGAFIGLVLMQYLDSLAKEGT